MSERARIIDLRFPVAGVDRSYAFQQQPPYSTPDALNVRPSDPVGGRERGGSRPGLAKRFDTALGGPVRMMAEVSISDTRNRRAWGEKIKYPLSTRWTVQGGAWEGDSNLVAASAFTEADLTGGKSYIEFDFAPSKTVSSASYTPVQYWSGPDANFIPYKPDIVVSLGGTFVFWLWVAAGAASGYENGVRVSITIATRSIVCERYLASSVVDTVSYTYPTTAVREVFTFRSEHVQGSGYTHYVNGKKCNATAQPANSGHGMRMAFVDNSLVQAVRCCFDVAGLQTEQRGRVLLASANGAAYLEDGPDMVAISSSETLSSVRNLRAAEWGQKLYVADHGDARVPKVIDPKARTMGVWSATSGKGTVPTGCPGVCRFMDRLVLAGSPSHMWYMSRQGDPNDWQYTADYDDLGRAVSATSSDAGTIGQPITALMPHGDDYMLFGCLGEIWRLVGDPAAGGRLSCLSRVVGVVDWNAYCYGPSGEVILLSHDGVYVIGPGPYAQVEPVSGKKLPRDLQSLDPETYAISISYDPSARGVHIFVSPRNDGASQHWFLDWETKSFWPVKYGSSDYDPMCCCILSAAPGRIGTVLLGGRDGYLRHHQEGLLTDDGSVFESYVLIGPVSLGGDFGEGQITEIVGTVAEDSMPVFWSVYTEKSFERAVSYPRLVQTGTWVPGLTYRSRPRGRGGAFVLKLHGTGGWCVEGIDAKVIARGMLRK